MEMGEESEEYDVTLSCPAGQVWLANSDVMLTVELYICEHNFPVINLILFLLRAQNNRFEVCEMQGRDCVWVAAPALPAEGTGTPPCKDGV